MNAPQSAPAKPAALSPAQLRAIWGRVSKLISVSGMDRDQAETHMRAAVKKVSAQEHTGKLTSFQANLVLTRLDELCAPYEKKEKAAPAKTDRNGRITPKMQAVLSALFIQAGMPTHEQRVGFTRRQIKKPWPQTLAEADKLFAPLSDIALRKVSPTEARDRVLALVGKPCPNGFLRDWIVDVAEQYRRAAEEGDLSVVMTPHKLKKLVEAEHACGVVDG